MTIAENVWATPSAFAQKENLPPRLPKNRDKLSKGEELDLDTSK
jgi:hypothetical protein